MSQRVPICLECCIEMRCRSNDQLVNDIATPGFPAMYWVADVFQCPICEHKIATGFGHGFRKHALLEEGLDPETSITFARQPKQLEQYAEQFTGAKI